MYPKIRDWKAFALRVSLICRLITEAVRGTVPNKHVVSVDEKTGIQAVSRISSPRSEGQPGRREVEYTRNGTLTLIAAEDVATGQVVHARNGQTRNERDFLEFCQKTAQAYPETEQVVFLADQLNTHKSESLVRWVAEETGFDGDLGKKGKNGILRDMETRKTFLEQEGHRIRFVFTPRHCSWLNPVENFFSKLQRQALSNDSFGSVGELGSRITSYIAYYNEYLLKPINWKFKGFVKNKILKHAIMVDS